MICLAAYTGMLVEVDGFGAAVGELYGDLLAVFGYFTDFTGRSSLSVNALSLFFHRCRVTNMSLSLTSASVTGTAQIELTGCRPLGR